MLVKESGARSWVYRFMIRGKSSDIGLGPAVGADAVSLAAARDLAAALRLKVKAGVDPLAQRLEAATAAVAAAQASKVAPASRAVSSLLESALARSLDRRRAGDSFPRRRSRRLRTMTQFFRLDLDRAKSLGTVVQRSISRRRLRIDTSVARPIFTVSRSPALISS